MNRLTNLFFSFKSVAIALVLLLGQSAIAQDEAQSTSITADKIEWISFEEAFEKNKTHPKPWIIDIYTDWCGWCKRLDQTTFVDSIIVDEIRTHFYAVKLDGEQKADIVLGEETYSFVESGRRGYHELPAALMNGNLSYPTIVFLSDKLQNLQPVQGYKSAKDFHPIVSFFAIFDAENPIKWEDFMSTYQSPYN